MNESQKDFRDRLLAAENLTPAYREKYERELKMIMEHKLTAKDKRTLIIWTLICGLVAATAQVLLIFWSKALDFPRLFQFVLVAITFGVLGKAFILVRILRRSGSNQADGALHDKLQWWFIVLIGFLLVCQSSDSPDDLYAGFLGVFIIILISVYQIRYSIGQSQLQTREKLLKLECQFAELMDHLNTVQAGQGRKDL